jgi:hypothetical protein
VAGKGRAELNHCWWEDIGKETPGGIQLKRLHMNANESDNKNEVTPKKGGGF